MSEGKRYIVTNTAAGPRGVYQDDGSYVEIPAGETRSVDLTDAEYNSAKGTGHFSFGKAGEKAQAAATAVAGQEGAADALPSNIMKLRKIARDESIELGSAASVDAVKAAILSARAVKAGGAGGIGAQTPGDDLDTLDDNTLQATVAAITGKAVADLPTDRDELLKLARGVE